ncbi:hypothetical protein V8F20_003627 [Naviculisporaceae sp. PSN 640]
MCLQVTYRCPLCQTPSFTEYPHTCDEGGNANKAHTNKCVGLVKLDRWITNKQHLGNWFCSKDTCEYSRVSQAVQGLEIEDIVRAQKKGYQHPPVPQFWKHQAKTLRIALDAEYAATVNPTSSTTAAGASSGQAKAPIADMKENQNKHAAYQSLILGTAVPKNNIANSPVVKASNADKRQRFWIDLSTLDPGTQRQIRDLRHEVLRYGNKQKLSGLAWWAKSETQLLCLCANLKFSNEQILTYLPRHDMSRLKMRLAHLRGVANGQLLKTLEPRVTKVPVSVRKAKSTASQASLRK